MAGSHGLTAPQCDLENLDTSTWGVDVRIGGVNVLTIESGCLSGIPNIGDYQAVVWNCAEHLRSFIGDPNREPEPCFACGGSGQERSMGPAGETVIPCSVCAPQHSTDEAAVAMEEACRIAGDPSLKPSDPALKLALAYIALVNERARAEAAEA